MWKKIEITLKGETPLLMHNAEAMERQKPTKNPTQQYDDKEYAERVSYRDKDGYLCIPKRCIKPMMLGGASWFKFGKRSAKQIIAGLTRIEPERPVITDAKGKKLKKYDIDLCPVVIQNSRIIRARPRIDDWKLNFNLIYNAQVIKDTEIIKQILIESGQRIGLLDNRPQKYGEYGTFSVEKFREVK